MTNQDPYVTPAKWSRKRDEECRGCTRRFTPDRDHTSGYCQICEPVGDYASETVSFLW